MFLGMFVGRIFFVFSLRSPTVVSERSMSRCRYDLEHMGMCGHCTMFCASIRCDLLLDVHVASLVFANILILTA